ncbi:hypothetical protein Dda_8620 [Drechslerella dactyloides]|uniref:Uncharacterized protein n=1 Tax=Drechslerella dactyloides TaxID=74499 RepID=A0AAD6IQZ1_DREDA|nr:hypothetical protein Dda_8620 [Drechslerella dactyloides]
MDGVSYGMFSDVSNSKAKDAMINAIRHAASDVLERALPWCPPEEYMKISLAAWKIFRVVAMTISGLDEWLKRSLEKITDLW